MIGLAILAAACAPAETPETGQNLAHESVTGVVISADGPDASQVDRFSLRTTSGRLLDFSVGRLDVEGGGLPAPHLREHLVSGQPITVYFSEDENGGLVAVRYVDADQ